MSSQRRFLICAVVILSLGLLSSASPSTYLTADDKASVSRLLSASQKSDGSYLGLKNTYYAVAAHNELKKLAKDAANLPNKDKICEYAKGALKTTAIEDIYYQVFILNALGCAQTADDKIRATIQAALSSSSSKSLLDLYYGVQSATILKEKVDAGAVTQRILNHVDLDNDALFRVNVDEEEGAIYLTGLALEALASLGGDKTKLRTVLDSATKTLFSRFVEENDEAGTIYFTDEGQSPLKVTGQTVKGIFSLAGATDHKPAGATADQWNALAEYLVQSKQVGTVEDAYYVLGALHHLANNKWTVPLVVSVPSATLSASAKGNEGFVKVKLTDVAGNPPASKAKVTLLKAYPVNKPEKAITTNQQFTEGTDGVYQFDLIGTGKADLGFYTLEVKAVPDDAKFLAAEKAERNVKVVGEAKVTDCQFSVAEPKSEPKKYSCDGKAVDFSADAAQTIQLSFSVKAASSNKQIQVQQAFLRLSNSDNSIEKILVVPFNGKQYSLKVSFNDLKGDFSGASGKYNAELIVGDAFLANPSVSKISSITVTYPESAKSSRSESPFAPKNIIEHQFRAPEKRPPVVISTAFTAAVLAPALILFIGFLRIGANINNFPMSGTAFLNAVGFQGTVGAILALFALFWLRLNMVQTLVYLGFLSLPFLYFAKRNLSYLATKSSKAI